MPVGPGQAAAGSPCPRQVPRRGPIPSAPATPYPEIMTSPDTDKPFAEVLAEHGRPVTAEGLDRARDSLTAAAERRDPEARAELLARLRVA